MQDFPGEIVVQSSNSIQQVNPTQQGLNLTGTWETVKRNILPIIGISSVAAIVFSLTNSYTPIYTGDFQLLVEPVTSEAKFSEPSTLTSSSKGGYPGSLEMDYSTIITILKSPGMLASIVEQVQVKYPEFTQKQLRDNLKISRLNLDEFDLSNQTKIIEVSYQESDPDLVDLVLEKTAEKYLRYSLEDRKTQIGQGIEFIEAQLPELNRKVVGLQIKLQNLREKNQFIDPELKGESLLKQVEQINIQQLETKGELKKLKALKQNLEQQLNMNPEEAILALALGEDANYQKLLEQSKLLDSQISIQTAKFTNNSPQVQALYYEQQNLMSLLTQESRRILGNKYQPETVNSALFKSKNSLSSEMTQQLVETTNKIELLEIQLNSLKTNQNQFEQQAQQLPNVSRQYAGVTKELAIANQTLDQLTTQRDALRIELAQSQIPWEIISSPQLLKDSVGFPTPLPQNSEKQLMLSLFGSLIIGIGTVVVFEKSRNVFYAAKDIEQQLQIPLLGTIPPNDDLEQNNPEFLDAFDALYGNIKFRFSEATLRSVVVSSISEENKINSIALHLAETVAAMGYKVLLVDANLRLPTLHSRLYLDNEKGLCDLLVEQADLDFHDVVQKSARKENLFMITSGQILPNSTRMLASNQMKNLNQELESAFDLVIYDAPALLNCMDTSFLATHTDGIMTILEVGKTSKSLVRKTSEQIEKFQLNNLGIIAILPT
ncbi:polysaccharide biosynthesis tyrosine autokinase [Waterburya agarophytonicola K14]|uniref:non-specific protein-tyrosine kinase n=1 Tax=Waterburya agarophytonicola KI4 TaxID=2874699 RepID=A0A964BPI8_9CYAN|nr:tyrosine-protein kinase domain-containing protein [Waterburya agarophytonicola]MCC0176138.1 polysaccharide biosynthesis tyrosine autokinase [Waterburya agarophytonicola KI4]